MSTGQQRLQVFKFGGASINSIERIKNVGDIIRHWQQESLLVIISAMGKTTNALEKVAEAFFAGSQEASLQLFEAVKQDHIGTARALLEIDFDQCLDHLNDIFTEAEWMLHDKPVRDYDYYYDQIVCLGEMLSTIIVSAYLNETGIKTQWLDVRDIIRTDDNFRDANIDWEITKKAIANLQWIKDDIQASIGSSILLTQGFVGATDENESTTLGREGSDYTAAIFANLLDAKSMTIWKDVECVMNADPRQFADAVAIPELNYEEVIEMAYYGAQVIHPKTIKPLYQKSIPLYVKCFLDPSLPGTVVHNNSVKHLPPIIVRKENQVLIHFHSKDYSFVGERPIGQLYHLFEQLSIRPSLTQNGAISFLCCVDDREDKNEKLAFAASEFFDIQIEKGLTLLTIRHYEEDLVHRLIQGKEIVLKQQEGRETIQVLLKD
ncbi:MAG: aspartate kinase [Chitinophagaceae bacterium]